MNTYKGSNEIEDEAKRLGSLALIANEELTRILNEIKDTGFGPRVIADFGCGTGDALGIFEDIFPEASIVGFDQSEKAIAIAHEKYPKINFFIVDITKEDELLAVLDQLGSIDLAYFRNTLLHLPDPLGVLGNIKNRLSINGVLLAQEPDWDMAEANWKDFSIFKTAFTAMMKALAIDPYIGKKLEDIFKKLGFNNINNDISTKKIFPTDSAWEILNQLIEVGGERLAPFLQKEGIKSVEEMVYKIKQAKESTGSYYRTPAWVITWGTK